MSITPIHQDPHHRFARELVEYLHLLGEGFEVDPQPQALRVSNDQGEVFVLDMTPFLARPHAPSAMKFFDGVRDLDGLLMAYQTARASMRFEDDLDGAMQHVDAYAKIFMAEMLAKGRAELNDHQARLIASWVKNLDVYCAIKSIESFLYSHADLKLLEIAPNYDWDVVFDHMAIRCGSKAHQDAERVADLLRSEHGYVSTQFAGEAYYQFPDGWNAYPVYKMLDNGQALRVFVDQSDADDEQQIIQHWNRVYGYTAHHIGIRATKLIDGQRVAVPLEDVMAALEKAGIKILTPTGQYTRGLLQQVFSQPEKNTAIPVALKQDIVKHGPQLEKTIENAKLLELVSRRELPPGLAMQLFALYGLKYDAQEPLHSAPVYQYFLPVQAAHVIKTSQWVMTE